MDARSSLSRRTDVPRACGSAPRRVDRLRRRVATLGVIVAAIGLLAALSLLGCRSVLTERVDAGFFPTGSDYVHHDWNYMVVLTVETSDAGPMTRLQNKTVFISVVDRSGKRLLNDRVDVRSCMVVGRSTWATFENLEVVIREEGAADSGDPYSVALAKSGPRTVMKLRYEYDKGSASFRRIR